MLKKPTIRDRAGSPSSNEENELNDGFNMHREKPKTKTRVIVKYDVGFSNNLYLRGSGANLSWERGVPLKNVSADEWVWETDIPFSSCEFKVLVNDKDFEAGENHILKSGATLRYTPNF